MELKGYLSAVASSVLQSSKIVSFCIVRFIEHNIQSTSDVSLVSQKQGILLQKNGMYILQWSGDDFKSFEELSSKWLECLLTLNMFMTFIGISSLQLPAMAMSILNNSERP